MCASEKLLQYVANHTIHTILAQDKLMHSCDNDLLLLEHGCDGKTIIYHILNTVGKRCFITCTIAKAYYNSILFVMLNQKHDYSFFGSFIYHKK